MGNSATTCRLLTPFPSIIELNELKGPINDTDNIFIRPANLFVTSVWYKYIHQSRLWQWTPYETLDPWISVDTLIVPSGSFKGRKPAEPNILIIDYLKKHNPIPPSLSHFPVITSSDPITQSGSILICAMVIWAINDYDNIDIPLKYVMNIRAPKQLNKAKGNLLAAFTMLNNSSIAHDDEKNSKHTDNTSNDKSMKSHTINSQNCLQNHQITSTLQNPACDINKCKCLSEITQILQVYNELYADKNVNMQRIVDNFIHLICNHQSDKDFAHIYKILGVCDISTCKTMRRHYANKIDYTKSIYYRLIDKMHCYFMHSYDIGYRLTDKHKNTIQTIIEEQKNDHDALDPDVINKMNQIVQHKRKMHNKFVIKNIDKFNQLEQPNNSTINYSFGQRFFYWKYFENNTTPDTSSIGYQYRDWYIDKKYNSFKHELTHNDIQTINSKEWEGEYNKAKLHHQNVYAKTFVAGNTKEHAVESYDIVYGTQIQIYHLLAIILYCGYDTLSTKFSKTFRRINISDDDVKDDDNKDDNIIIKVVSIMRTKLKPVYMNGKESDASLKKRHSNFYHLAKYITEAILIYNRVLYIKKYQTKFYHGIVQKVVFNSLQFEIYQPLSTTTERQVADMFSHKTGIVVQLQVNSFPYYFDCAWLSRYPNEKELLFIYCPKDNPLRVINIINSSNVSKEYNFITALSIIDSITTQDACTVNFNAFKPAIEHSVRITGKWSGTLDFNPAKYGNEVLGSAIKLHTIRMIKHELNRYKPQIYDKLLSIEPYINKLLHNICLKKHIVSIDWKYMNTPLIHGQSPVFSGYQGYFFLKYLFCENEYPMIKLDFITLLYPNAKIITLSNMTYISKNCLIDILNYIDTLTDPSKQLLISLELKSSKNVNDDSIMQTLLSSYWEKFYDKKWLILIHPDYNGMVIYNFNYFYHANYL